MKTKKFSVFLLALLNYTIILAQEKKDENQDWTTSGNISFIFNQSAFSNWAAGGDNTIAGNISLNYKFNYKKGNTTWKNNIISSYGLTKSKNTEFEKKTDDRFELNSLLGINADNYWYYSVLFNFKTQFTKGYKYFKTEEGVEDRAENTNFFSPATFLLGPGMLWEKSENFKFNIAPSTTKLIIVDKNFTLPNGAYFGVEEGKSTRLELGFSATGYFKFDIMENISAENIIAIYSNYLENPENVDLDYTLTIFMKINKYFTTNFIFQTIYDDNAFEGFQLREVFGFGVKYDF
jgi:hypothetical protein